MKFSSIKMIRQLANTLSIYSVSNEVSAIKEISLGKKPNNLATETPLANWLIG